MTTPHSWPTIDLVNEAVTRLIEDHVAKERYIQLNFGAEMSALDESAAVIAEASAAAQVRVMEFKRHRDFAVGPDDHGPAIRAVP